MPFEKINGTFFFLMNWVSFRFSAIFVVYEKMHLKQSASQIVPVMLRVWTICCPSVFDSQLHC